MTKLSIDLMKKVVIVGMGVSTVVCQAIIVRRYFQVTKREKDLDSIYGKYIQERNKQIESMSLNNDLNSLKISALIKEVEELKRNQKPKKGH